MPKSRNILLVAGVAGITGVLAGTFGAHGLKARLSPEMLEIFETGVRYHLIHAVALLALAALAANLASMRMLSAVAFLFASGILIFSGSLYLLAITDHKWLGMITPIGGALFIIGWLCLIILALWSPLRA